jgi:hypothetical protein
VIFFFVSPIWAHLLLDEFRCFSSKDMPCFINFFDADKFNFDLNLNSWFSEESTYEADRTERQRNGLKIFAEQRSP